MHLDNLLKGPLMLEEYISLDRLLPKDIDRCSYPWRLPRYIHASHCGSKCLITYATA